MLSIILFIDPGREHICLVSPAQRAGAMRSPSGTLSSVSLCLFTVQKLPWHCLSLQKCVFTLRQKFSLEGRHFSRVMATSLKPSK